MLTFIATFLRLIYFYLISFTCSLFTGKCAYLFTYRPHAAEKYVSVGIQTDISCVVNTEYFGPPKRKSENDAASIAISLLSSITLPSYSSMSLHSSLDAPVTNDAQGCYLVIFLTYLWAYLLSCLDYHSKYERQEQQDDIYHSSDDEIIDESKKAIKLPKRYRVGFAERTLGVCLFPSEDEINGIYGGCIKRGVIGQVHKRYY